MNDDREELLAEVFIDVLEKLAFMFGELISKDDLPRAGGDYIKSVMSFSGEKSGSLELAVPQEFSSLFAANVLGEDPDEEIAQERANDALREVLNVTCGNMLTALYGEKPIFDLTVPETVALDAEGWRELRELDETIALLVDDVPALLRFVVKD